MYFCYFSKVKKINHELIHNKMLEGRHNDSENKIIAKNQNIFIVCSNEDGSTWQNSNETIIAGKIRIYNSRELTKDINLANENLILKLYREEKNEFLNKLNGDFSFIIFDEKTNSLFIARDHIGHFQLFYINDAEKTIICSSLEVLLHFTEKPEINEKWLYDMLAMDVSDKNLTVYKNIYRFIPAHYYKIESEKFSMQRYWYPGFYKKSAEVNKESYIETFKGKFKKAVLERMFDGPNGFELSGGLDSSLITCNAAKFGTGNMVSFSHTLPKEAQGKYKPFVDEKQHIEKVKQLYPGLNVFYIDYPENDILTDITKNILSAKNLPQQQIHIVSHDLYSLVKDKKATTLFSGFGGDEMLSSSGYFHILELLFKSRYFEILKIFLKRKHNRFGYLRFLLAKWKDICLYKLGTKHNISGNKQNDLPLNNKRLIEIQRILKKRNVEPDKGNYYYSKLLEKINLNHVTSRVENCQNNAIQFGFEYKYPMLDKELLEYYLMLPPECHYSPQWPRNLLRQAAKDIVPVEILKRRDKSGATIPNVPYRVIKDYNVIKSFLTTYNQNSKICNYISIAKLLKFLDQIVKDTEDKTKKTNHRILLNYLTILKFYELFETGKLLNTSTGQQ